MEVGELIGKAREEFPDVPPGELAEFVKKSVKELRQVPEDKISTLSSREIDEYELLSDSKSFFKNRFDAEEVEVHKADEEDIYDPDGRADRSVPFKPAIYVE